MNFAISCTRQMVGYRVDVEVKAEGTEAIVSVVTKYDDFEIGNDYLNSPEVYYQRTFKQIGGYTPGVDHSILVTATTDAGVQRTASKSWQD